jgi:Zn-dependent protease
VEQAVKRHDSMFGNGCEARNGTRQVKRRIKKIDASRETRARQMGMDCATECPMPDIDFAAGLLWYFVFLYSTVCHEAAHAWAALRLGDDTAYRGGQVSLDPVPHIRREPVGMVVFPILTFFMSGGKGGMMGWASAPYDPAWALRHPRHAAWMALAGPATNLLLVIAAGLAIRVGLEAGWFRVPGRFTFADIVQPVADGGVAQFAAMFLGVVFSLNLLLMAFNLIPLPPFDGASAPLLFLSGRSAEAWQQMMWNPALQLVSFIVAYKGFGVVFPPILTAGVNLLYLGHAHFG